MLFFYSLRFQLFIKSLVSVCSVLGYRSVGSLYRGGVWHCWGSNEDSMVCPHGGLDGPPQPLPTHGQARNPAALLQGVRLAPGPLQVGGVRLGELRSCLFLCQRAHAEDGRLHYSTAWHPEAQSPLCAHFKRYCRLLTDM